MDIPECDSNCSAHFHMTGGRHLTNCALHKYDDVAAWLDLAKMYICTGSDLFDRDFFAALNVKLCPFISDIDD